jgi:phage-related protein (TIGR01555 family)
LTLLDWITATLAAWTTGPATPPQAQQPRIDPPPVAGMRIRPEALAQARATAATTTPLQLYTTRPRTRADSKVFAPAKPPPGVVPEGARLAMDDDTTTSYANVNYSNDGGEFGEGLHWLGYPYLAELTQRAEYRRITETMAREMTRSWIKITKTGEKAKNKRIEVIERELIKHEVQDKFRRIAELDGYFGRAHLYLDVGVPFDDRDLMKTALIMDRRLFAPNSLKNIKVVEPTWTYPGNYNSFNPLARDFFTPTTWYVMATEVHRTRLLTFVSRPMPDLLKPAYAFGGLSMSQMAKPYIDNWLRTQQSVSDLIHSFSVMVLSTDMSGLMNSGGGEQEAMRAMLFNAFRDNRGLFMVDKDKETLTNVSTSLGTLDHLQAQAQEHMASVSGEPLVVLTGITPSGLNASSEGELQVWAQTVRSMQEHLFTANLTVVIEAIQLDQFGDIDPGIKFDYNPLEEESDEQRGTRLKAEADTHGVYIDKGVLGPDEVREVLAHDEDSPYAGIDLSGPPPTPPSEEPDPLAGGAGDDPAGGGAPGVGGSGGAAPKPPGGAPGAGGKAPKPGDPRGVRDAAEGDTIDEIAKVVAARRLAKDSDSTPVKRYNFDGLQIGIENPKGSVRRGRDWECVMPADYGFIMRTDGWDGDSVDVFVGPLTPEQLPVWVIDQNTLGGQFDEHKVMLGFETLTDALACYDASFSDGSGPRRRGDVHMVAFGDLKSWLKENRRGGGLAEDANSDFHEDDVKRDEGGKFAKSASGAKAGAAFHKAKANEYKDAQKGSVSRPHNRAAKHYGLAAGHYASGNNEEGDKSHAEAEAHGKVAHGRELKFNKSVMKAPPAKKDPDELSAEEKAPESGAELYELLKKKLDGNLPKEASDLLKPVFENIDKLTAENKPKVLDKLKDIYNSFAMNPDDADAMKVALGSIEPIIGHGMSVGAVNAALASAKKEYGAKAEEPKPYEPTTEIQKKVYDKLSKTPHYKQEHVNYFEDHEGKELRAVLKTDTKKIPGDHYAKVTSAYSGNHNEGNTSAVADAMDSYRWQQSQKFTEDQASALVSYKGSGYDALNEALLSGDELTGGKKKMAEAIDSAIAVSVIPATTPVFRGLKASLKDLSGFDDPELAVGRSFNHANFASTSRKQATSENFASGGGAGKKMLMKFNIPAGANGVVLGSQGTGSEAEIVLPRNAVFRIDKVEDREFGYSKDKGHLLHVTYLGTKEDV